MGREKAKVCSRLIQYLEEDNKEIEWDKSCWADGVVYQKECLVGRRDNEFTTTTYFANLNESYVGVDLSFDIDWSEEINSGIYHSTFNLSFSEWSRRLGLNPKPANMNFFSTNHYFEEKENPCFRDIPIFQAKYYVMFLQYFDEAKIALDDFVERRKDLTKFFKGMNQESTEQFEKLMERFKQYECHDKVVRICN
ncbi:MAG: hypothetical protein Q8P15_02715 [Nanoarchaeota archaeon]|nr:hypothetical protein [Nanoarchaeota archaeon]